jgi:hypothetical protein
MIATRALGCPKQSIISSSALKISRGALTALTEWQCM